MKPSILFLEQQSWKGGAQQVLLEVLDSVREDFHPIIAFPGGGPFRNQLADLGFETLTYPLGSYHSGEKSLADVIEFSIRSVLSAAMLAYFVLRRDVGMIYINGPRCLPSGALAARITPRPVLFHLHNVLTRRSDVMLATFCARSVSQVIACSRAAADSLVNHKPELRSRVKVLYNPAPKLREENSNCVSRPPSPLTFGAVGRITEAKGLHVLIEAAAKLEPELRAKIRLLIVGAPSPESRKDKRYLKNLQSKAATIGIEHQVLWAGFQENVNRFYEMMDVLVIPSVGTEGHPMVALEALQRGIPVIASRTGGIPETISDQVNGLLVPPGRSEELANCMSSLICNNDLYRKLRAGARRNFGGQYAQFSRAIHAICTVLSSGTHSDDVQDRQPEVRRCG